MNTPSRLVRALQHLGMTQRAHHVAVAGLPVLLHRAARELVVLRRALVALGVIDQVDDVVDLLVGLLASSSASGVCRSPRSLCEQPGGRAAQQLLLS